MTYQDICLKTMYDTDKIKLEESILRILKPYMHLFTRDYGEVYVLRDSNVDRSILLRINIKSEQILKYNKDFKYIKNVLKEKIKLSLEETSETVVDLAKLKEVLYDL